MIEKECSKCKVVKPFDAFHKCKRAKYGFAPWCKECKKEYDKQYHQEHKEERSEWERKYRTNRRANDRAWALRMNISRQVNKMLKSNDSTKDGESILQYLPYTKEELVEHLENQFEPGMTWDNHSMDGWHIDHIYPHSLLPYDSMNHPNFQKAWSLSNLRPLWAKENLSKGNKIIER